MWPELQDSKLCPSTRFPSRPTILERGQGFVVLYPGLIGTWVKPRIGGRGVISACGAQRHWWDQTLLKGIRGFGVGLLCPSLFLPFMLLTLSGKEDLAWHALSSSWQLPPGDSAGRASGASAVLGQLQPSWFLCRTELSFTVTFPTPHPLWCCLPPTPLSATPALQPQRLLSLLLG